MIHLSHNRLRRKGHLKEQDAFISLLLRMHEMHSCLEVMTKMERWITEHRRDPRGSQLSRMVPSVVSSFVCSREVLPINVITLIL